MFKYFNLKNVIVPMYTNPLKFTYVQPFDRSIKLDSITKTTNLKFGMLNNCKLTNQDGEISQDSLSLCEILNKKLK